MKQGTLIKAAIANGCTVHRSRALSIEGAQLASGGNLVTVRKNGLLVGIIHASGPRNYVLDSWSGDMRLNDCDTKTAKAIMTQAKEKNQ